MRIEAFATLGDTFIMMQNKMAARELLTQENLDEILND